jgi:site-specific DNA-adenine methylase
MNYKDLKTPLRYPGGKSRATKFLFEEGSNMPQRTIKEYREPFLGGGSCAFWFAKNYPEVPVWVNDKYYNLFCFWTILKEDGDRLTTKLHDVKDDLSNASDSIKEHLDYYKVMREGLSTATDPFEIAWMFYVMNRCSFSGLGETTGSFSKTAISTHFNHRIISRLPKFSRLMKNWKITNLDYSELFDNNPDTFVFSDPPYDIKSFIYGNKGDMHDTFDHKEFHDCADASENMVMITYNSNEELQKEYHNWNQKVWDLTYTMHSGKNYTEDEHNRKELLLLNYKSETPSSLEDFF